MTRLHDPEVRGFASDNYSGIHPEVLAAIAEANGGHQPGYGDDVYTVRLQEVIRERFGASALAFPVFNGTGANVVALRAMMPRWGAVVTTDTAHIHTDEGGAAEQAAGIKLLTVPTPDGKLTPEFVDRVAHGWGDVHHPQPLVLSLTQATERGTVYTPDEVRALSTHAHERGMLVHMDGSRLASAAVSLDVPPAAFTSDAGVDVLSLGGTKNGAMLGEAIVVFNETIAQAVAFGRKSLLQLSSKMRFVSAQLIALWEGDLWARNARHSQEMAQKLRADIEERLSDGRIRGVVFTQPTQANAIFAVLPEGVADALRASFRFYDWDAARGEVRWMCGFDTTAEDVEAFVEELSRLTATR